MSVENNDGGAISSVGPWRGVFDIDDVDGGPIKLFQVGSKGFELRSKIRYRAKTGLDGEGLDSEVLDDIRTLDPADEGDGVFRTDLASVPGLARWFLGTYGVHTPAVLIHDRLIPIPKSLKGMTDQHADRYLRFMLQALEMRWLKRWVMWTAVAMRTRFAVGGWRRISVITWVVAAAAGMIALVVGIVDGNLPLVISAALAPLPFALLWGRQYGAGLIAALAVPWFLPPTLLAAAGYFVYLVVEWFVGLFFEKDSTGSYGPEGI